LLHEWLAKEDAVKSVKIALCDCDMPQGTFQAEAMSENQAHSLSHCQITLV